MARLRKVWQKGSPANYPPGAASTKKAPVRCFRTGSAIPIKETGANMNSKLRTALAASAVLMATHASAAITFYEGEGFRGRAFTTDKQVHNFARFGFNDRASSVVVDRGRWEVCDDAAFHGRCVVLRP